MHYLSLPPFLSSLPLSLPSFLVLSLPSSFLSLPSSFLSLPYPNPHPSMADANTTFPCSGEKYTWESSASPIPLSQLYTTSCVMGRGVVSKVGVAVTHFVFVDGGLCFSSIFLFFFFLLFLLNYFSRPETSSNCIDLPVKIITNEIIPANFNILYSPLLPLPLSLTCCKMCSICP